MGVSALRQIINSSRLPLRLSKALVNAHLPTSMLEPVPGNMRIEAQMETNVSKHYIHEPLYISGMDPDATCKPVSTQTLIFYATDIMETNNTNRQQTASQMRW